MIRFPVDCKKNKLPSRQSGKLFIYEILYFKIHFILQCIFLFYARIISLLIKVGILECKNPDIFLLYIFLHHFINHPYIYYAVLYILLQAKPIQTKVSHIFCAPIVTNSILILTYMKKRITKRPLSSRKLNFSYFKFII